MSANLSFIRHYVDLDVHIWTEHSLLKNKCNYIISLPQIQSISIFDTPFGQFYCFVGTNNSSNHVDSGLVPVQVSEEDVCVVRVLCVWRCIQTGLWGFEPLESCHFYLFQLFLSAVCNCGLPIMLFTQKNFFLSSTIINTLLSLPPSPKPIISEMTFHLRHTQQSEDFFYLFFYSCFKETVGHGHQTQFWKDHYPVEFSSNPS